MATGSQHVALLIEDDPAIASLLRDLASSLGHRSIVASTLEEVRAAIDAGGYCYVLLDMQLPPSAGATAQVGCGETALEWLRAKDSRRAADGRHLLQILVVSSYSREPEFISRVLEMDANAFVAKQSLERSEVLIDKIRVALGRAGRREHAACEALGGDAGAARAEASGATGLTLAIDGEKKGRNTGIAIGGVRCWLQDLRFLVFLRLVVAHLRRPGTWVEGHHLGLVKRSSTPTRICEACAAGVPEGFRIVENDGNGRFRLNPEVRVGAVAWGELERHAVEEVIKVAMEGRRYGGEGGARA